MPATSDKQRKFMAMVYRTKKEGGRAPSREVAKAARSMTTAQARDFAKKSKRSRRSRRRGRS